MTFKTAKLPSGRWGIFNGKRLLLTVGSQQTVELMRLRLTSKQIPLSVTGEA